MGSDLSIHDATNPEHAEILHWSAFTSPRHRRWYFGDPEDCIVYFVDNVPHCGAPDRDDFGGRWEPDWAWCRKMAGRILSFLATWEPSRVNAYSEADKVRARVSFEEYRARDEALYTRLIDLCDRGLAEPGRWSVSLSF